MKTIDKIITKCSCKSGAPRGRGNKGHKPTDKTIFDCAVTLCKGGYDKGSTYWGIGAMLRVSYTKDLNYLYFYRV